LEDSDFQGSLKVATKKNQQGQNKGNFILPLTQEKDLVEKHL